MALFNEQSDDVNFKHPEYTKYYEQIKLVGDVFDGIDSAKVHLQKTFKETDDSYRQRQNLATLKNFVKRATEAFVGMIYRKPVSLIGFSDEMMDRANVIDRKSNMNKFSRELTTALVRDGKVFLFVDTPIGGGSAYISIMNRQNVINWRKNADGVYTMLVYTEFVEVDAGDFGLDLIQQWRVVRDDGSVTIYREDADNQNYYIYEEIQTDFDYIPIVDIELDNIPPLYDIAKYSIKHMSRTSFKDKYLDMSAVPIPLIWDSSGGDDNIDGTKPAYVIGVDEAFVFTGTKDESDFQWRELTGSSITALQDDLAVIEEDITSGVIRAAQSDNTTMKTATQSFYEAAESSNRVTVIANAVEIGLNKTMVMVADAMNETLDDTARVIVNKDFNAITQNTDNLRLLWEVYLGGALSVETFLNSLESFEVIDIGSVDSEIKRIEKDKFTPNSKADESDNSTTKNMDNRTVSAIKNSQSEDE
jgi:hypothetical protein